MVHSITGTLEDLRRILAAPMWSLQEGDAGHAAQSTMQLLATTVGARGHTALLQGPRLPPILCCCPPILCFCPQSCAAPQSCASAPDPVLLPSCHMHCGPMHHPGPPPLLTPRVPPPALMATLVPCVHQVRIALEGVPESPSTAPSAPSPAPAVLSAEREGLEKLLREATTGHRGHGRRA